MALLAMAAGALALGGGCGSDDDTGGTTPAAASAGAGGAACGQGMVDMTDPCEVCVGQNCTAEATACCEKPGCLELIDCVRETGCDTTNPLDPDKGCLANDKPKGCKTEIETATLPVAQTEATALGNCARDKCMMECGFMGTGGAGGGSGGGGGAGGN